MLGGARFKLKWDGYRCRGVCRSGVVRLWSRNGMGVHRPVPDVQAALAEQVVVDCMLDSHPNAHNEPPSGWQAQTRHG
jgi:ATP-dependent DNA ligase